MVPDRLWTHQALQPLDVRLWCALSFFARERGHCEPTDADLADKLGSSQQTIRRGLLRLEEAEFITRTMDGRTRVITLNTEGDGQPIEAFTLRVMAG